MANPHGVVAPRKENFVIKNARFFNFNWKEAAALGSCSHCFHPAATDSGSRTTKVTGLQFDDATVPRRIRYGFPFRAIFHDLDGSLTGKGPNSWATAFRKHHDQPECEHIEERYNGVICDNRV